MIYRYTCLILFMIINSYASDNTDPCNKFTMRSLPVLEKYVHVGAVPYSDPDKADIIFWNATITHDSSRGVELYLITGAKALVNVLRAKCGEHRHATMEHFIKTVFREYVRCPENPTYLELLEHIESADASSAIRLNMGYYYPNQGFKDLACPIQVRHALAIIAAHPPEELLSAERLFECTMGYLAKHKHQGSYVVTFDYDKVDKFLTETENVLGKGAQSTGWIMLNKQPEPVSIQLPQL